VRQKHAGQGPQGQVGGTSPEGPRLMVCMEPLNLESAPAALAAPVTPPDGHYVRDHFSLPMLDEEQHRIAVEGAVATPLQLSLETLRQHPWRTLVVTLECAGNGRSGMVPLPKGEPWMRGAVSTAEWSGVPLRDVLHEAGLRDDVCEILVEGADAGTPEEAPGQMHFVRSLPIDKALDPDTLLALEMNQEPLPREHGAPVRLVVPGWYGMASVKWVTRIAALPRPFDGYFQRQRYVYEHTGQPVTQTRVKSLIVTPVPGAVVPRGLVRVEGWAWSGARRIQSVDIAVDGGEDWQPAQVEPALSPHAWSRFFIDIELPLPGRHALRARARDEAGDVQPEVPEWNRQGYGNNAIVPVLIQVV
jgi:DMSO/TMAO reductase YedYZ molybdopterin-dependent catalytic subunit